MNKYDIRLLIILIVISALFIILSKISDTSSKKAIVYHNSDEILKIDLEDKSKRTYKVVGDNGDVVIETLDGMIRVVEEISPKHLCSKQGFIKNSHETIICLPNRIVIKIAEKEEIDTVVSVWN